MTRRRTFVIVGAGLAGAKAAQTLRLDGFDGRIVLIGSEADRPYERPPLSKGHLRGEEAPTFVHNEDFYADHDIDLRVGTRVTAIHPQRAQVEAADGERIPYDRLLLSTGARPRRLDVPGSGLTGIHYLRTVNDSDHLRDALKSAGRLAIIGAGWIGSEVAASARQLGVEVTLLDRGATPLRGVLGPEVGAVYRDLHLEHGVDFRPHTSVAGFLGRGRVEGIRTAAGDVVPADLVVVGVGAEPRTELAAGGGLDVDGGIVVDEQLQSKVPGIYAAGDVAAAWHPRFRRRIRVEHWANALHQGVVAAKNMLGASTVYDRLPYFYSDQYDLGMEYAGHAPEWDQVVFRGRPTTRQFIAFWLADDRVVAGMNANVWDVNDTIQALIRSGRPVDVDRLRDSALPLENVMAPASSSRSA